MNNRLIIAIGNKIMRDSFDHQKRLREIIQRIKTESKVSESEE